jgi:DNA-binding transcriptional MerR regulator
MYERMVFMFFWRSRRAIKPIYREKVHRLYNEDQVIDLAFVNYSGKDFRDRFKAAMQEGTQDEKNLLIQELRARRNEPISTEAMYNSLVHRISLVEDDLRERGVRFTYSIS